MTEKMKEEIKKNLGLSKLLELNISDRVFILLTGTQVTFYVDKISILYYQLSWTLIVFQGHNHLQIISYMPILALKIYMEARLRAGEQLLSSWL